MAATAIESEMNCLSSWHKFSSEIAIRLYYIISLLSRINNHLFFKQKIFFNLLYRTMKGMFYQIVRLLWNISKIFTAASLMENKDKFGENMKIALSGMSGIVRHVFGYFTTASMNCDSSMSWQLILKKDLNHICIMTVWLPRPYLTHEWYFEEA